MGFNWAFVCVCKAQFKPNNICANIIVLEMGLIVNENAWIWAQNGPNYILNGLEMCMSMQCYISKCVNGL